MENIREYLDEDGRINFAALRDNLEAQCQVAERTGLPLGFVNGLVAIAGTVSSTPKEALNQKKLLLQYVDEMFGD